MVDTSERRGTATRRIAWVLLVLYAIAVALIAFWPEPVDKNAVRLLERIEDIFPWATHERLEVGSNVIFFIPLGLLLSITLERSRHLVLPIGLLTTILIEGVQAELLNARRADISDILANTAGTCIGMLVAAVIFRRRPRRD